MVTIEEGRPYWDVTCGMSQWSPGGEGGGEIEFIEKLPGLFDEMRVFTDLGKQVTMARRRGDHWYVASMSDGHVRSCKLPLDFLRPGSAYNASIYSDVPGKLETSHVRQTVTSTSVIPIEMAPNGGHLMIIERTGGPGPAQAR